MSTPKDNDTQAITDFNEALRKVTYLEHVNAEKMNDATTDTQSTSALDNAADAAALAAGGNSLGAEMVEAFGEGRGQAMWAECEARKSGGAK